MRIILFLFFISSVWANEECDDSQINVSQDIADFAHSKCDTLSRLDPCSSCSPPLIKDQLVNIQKPTEKEIKDTALKVAIDEYKKVVIRNIVDLAKARTLPNTSGNFQKAQIECRAKKFDDFKTCTNEVKNFIKESNLFKDLNDQIGIEIATIVSKKSIKKEGLLTRTENACFIPEQTILQVSTKTVVETLTPELLSIIKGVKKGEYQSVRELFEDNDTIVDKFGERTVSELIQYTKNNPYLKDIFSSADNLISFTQSVQTPMDSISINNAIYTKQGGDKLDQEIAKRCNDSFTELEKFVCSSDFAKGNIQIDPRKNFDHMLDKENVLASETPTEVFLKQKKQALMFCLTSKENKNLNLEQSRLKISSPLSDPQRIESSLSLFSRDIYKDEIQGMNDTLCKEIQSNDCTDMTNMTCRLVANYKKTLVKDSPEYKMANSSNDDVNAVLRGMIGNPGSLDPEVREVLVKEGILPDSKGNIAETGNIPERQPMVMGQASGITQAKVAATSSASSGAKSNSPVRERPSFERTANFALPSRAPANAVANSFPPLPDFSDVYEKSDELKRFEEEIQRRLMGLDEPSKPKTVEEAKKVIRDAAKAMPSRPIFRPNVETKMAERLLESQNAGPLPKSAQDVEQEKRAQAIQDEKWEKELQNRAVSNMAGVRAALEKNGLLEAGAKGSPLAQANGQKKDLTKVALNIPEDPKVNLTEVFGKKFNGNDPETEVLKVLLNSKNDFLLKINELDFKVIFDENKQFKVLLQEGNKEEAFRIRPQLEIFLKRLSQKNSASKLSVDISRN